MPYVQLSQHWIVHATFLTTMLFIDFQPDVFNDDCKLLGEGDCDFVARGFYLIMIMHITAIILEFLMKYMEVS